MVSFWPISRFILGDDAKKSNENEKIRVRPKLLLLMKLLRLSRATDAEHRYEREKKNRTLRAPVDP